MKDRKLKKKKKYIFNLYYAYFTVVIVTQKFYCLPLHPINFLPTLYFYRKIQFNHILVFIFTIKTSKKYITLPPFFRATLRFILFFRRYVLCIRSRSFTSAREKCYYTLVRIRLGSSDIFFFLFFGVLLRPLSPGIFVLFPFSFSIY